VKTGLGVSKTVSFSLGACLEAVVCLGVGLEGWFQRALLVNNEK